MRDPTKLSEPNTPCNPSGVAKAKSLCTSARWTPASISPAKPASQSGGSAASAVSAKLSPLPLGRNTV